MVNCIFLLINRWGSSQSVGDAVPLTSWGMGAKHPHDKRCEAARNNSVADRCDVKRSADRSGSAGNYVPVTRNLKGGLSPSQVAGFRFYREMGC